jgi:predicted amidophosphoribosyltransferase
MVPLVGDFGNVDGLVPVPLHRTRLSQRGFNQSEELARVIGAATGLPVVPMLVRTKVTAPQVTLSQADRARNVAGAFALHADWVPGRGNRYLLIDDVRTSGATLGACADVLRQVPGVSVGALTFAVAR